jgi:hypothetical protein
VLAGSPLDRQPLTKERGDMRGDRGHRASPFANDSHRRATSAINCGVLSRYQ